MKILTRALKEEHRQVGLYLEEDDHLLYLMRGQRILERFSVTGVSIEAVHKAADKYMGSVRDG